MFVVRIAAAEDAAWISESAASVHRLHYERAPEVYKQPDADAGLPWYRELLATPGTVAFIAESDGGEPIGHAITVKKSAAEHRHFTRPAEFVELLEMGVAASWRGQGVGRALHDHLVAHWRAAGATELRLTVIGFNEDARRFYERLGYAEASRRLTRSLSQVEPTQPPPS